MASIGTMFSFISSHMLVTHHHLLHKEQTPRGGECQEHSVGQMFVNEKLQVSAIWEQRGQRQPSPEGVRRKPHDREGRQCSMADSSLVSPPISPQSKYFRETFQLLTSYA